MRPLHIVFGLSAASSLREGLNLAGRDEEVCALADNWADGPIDSEDLDIRLDAVEEMLEIDIDSEWREQIGAFWQIALDATRPRIVWFSKWSTMEYCGFLEWLRRNRDQAFALVDLSTVSIPDEPASETLFEIRSTSLVRAQAFADNVLWERAVPPNPKRVILWNGLWQRLRSENAALRVITPVGLESAPFDYFDREILSHAIQEWQPAARVVGETMGAMMSQSFREHGVYQCSDFVLFARVRALIEQGALDVQGDPYDLHYKVRLPAA